MRLLFLKVEAADETIADLKGAVSYFISGFKELGLVFQLYNFVTPSIFLFFSLIVTISEVAGKPISCTVEVGFAKYLKAINTYCWISSTFSVEEHFDKPLDDIVYPGIGPYSQKEHSIVRHTYYQWVTFMLLFQAVLFYIPRFIWKRIEDGRMNKLTGGCGITALIDSPDKQDLKDRMKLLITYIKEHQAYNTAIYFSYVFCEILNLVICILNIFLIDSFVGNEFTTYGADVIRHINAQPEDRTDPMSRVFPYLTKCTFPFYGPSGTIMLIDSLCVMAQNIINEKVYFFLWFYLLLLAVVGGIALLSRVTVTCLSILRVKKLVNLCQNGTRKDKIHAIVQQCGAGGWFVLFQLGQQMGPLLFEDFIDELYKNWGRDRDDSFEKTTLV